MELTDDCAILLQVLAVVYIKNSCVFCYGNSSEIVEWLKGHAGFMGGWVDGWILNVKVLDEWA